MSETPLPPVAYDEWLARFIWLKSRVRQNQTVRPDAFIPPKDLQLSVTRHINLSEEELWNIGQRVADQAANTPTVPLYGRADLCVRDVSAQNLRTEASPRDDNRNHADIIGWPLEKSARKIVAQELADRAVFRLR